MTQYNTCSTTKTYKSSINAAKQYAGMEIEGVTFETVLLSPLNCNNIKHHGRFIPVAHGIEAFSYNLHFIMHCTE